MWGSEKAEILYMIKRCIKIEMKHMGYREEKVQLKQLYKGKPFREGQCEMCKRSSDFTLLSSSYLHFMSAKFDFNNQFISSGSSWPSGGSERKSCVTQEKNYPFHIFLRMLPALIAVHTCDHTLSSSRNKQTLPEVQPQF